MRYFNTCDTFISPPPLGIGSSATDLSRPPVVRKQSRGHRGRAEANGSFNAKIPVAKGCTSRSNPSSEHDVSQCGNFDVDDSGYFLFHRGLTGLVSLFDFFTIVITIASDKNEGGLTRPSKHDCLDIGDTKSVERIKKNI